MIYYVLIVGITILALIGYTQFHRDAGESRLVVGKSELLFFLISVLVFIIIGFRARSIGADTINYLNKFDNINLSQSYSEFLTRNKIEPLFYYLNKILAIITGGRNQSIIIAEAFFVSMGFLTTIKKYSMDPFISLLAFIAFSVFSSSLCLLRQTIAMSICVYALKYVFEKKPLKFYFFILAAVSVHFSAIFFAIAYFVSVIMKCNRRNTTIFCMVSIAGYESVNILQYIVSTFFIRWKGYSVVETGAGGYISFIIFALITIMITLERKIIVNTYKYGAALINLNYVHMGVWVMRLVTRNVERITFYFVIAPILLLPSLFYALEIHYGKRVAFVVKSMAVFCMAVLFIYKIVGDSSYYPYYFCS